MQPLQVQTNPQLRVPIVSTDINYDNRVFIPHDLNNPTVLLTMIAKGHGIVLKFISLKRVHQNGN